MGLFGKSFEEKVQDAVNVINTDGHGETFALNASGRAGSGAPAAPTRTSMKSAGSCPFRKRPSRSCSFSTRISPTRCSGARCAS